jgi:hypothetical protein
VAAATATEQAEVAVAIKAATVVCILIRHTQLLDQAVKLVQAEWDLV